MSTPEGMPTLSSGSHSPSEGKACVMEYVALLAGEEWTDAPSCTHPVLAAMARNVNDRLPDSERYQLVPLIGRLFGTAPTGTDHEQQVLSVRLAAWSARYVLPLVREADRAVCERAILAAEAWADGTGSKQAAANAAANAAYAANAADAAANAAYAAANAAYADAAAYAAAAAAAYAAADAAADAAANAAYAAADAAANAAYAAADAAANAAYADAAANAAYAAAAYAGGLVAALTGLIDEYDRLTGRTNYREISECELSDMAARVTA